MSPGACQTLETVGGDLATQGVSVDAQQIGGFTQISFRPGQRTADKPALDLPPSIVVEDSLPKHFVDQAVELLTHASVSSPRRAGFAGCVWLREPCPGQETKRLEIFQTRLVDDVVRQFGYGRLPVPLDLVKIIANELFVEARLTTAGGITGHGPEPR